MSILHTYFEFIIEATVSLAVFGLFYLIVLRRLTHYQWNRFFLLGSLILSVAIGSVSIEIIESQAIPHPIEAISLGDFYPEFESHSEPTTADSDPSILTWITSNWKWMATGVFLIGGVAFLIQLLVQLILLTSKLRGSTPHPIHDDVRTTSNFKSAFAFLGTVYLPEGLLELSSEEVAKVIDHEPLHVRYVHGIDLLLLNILKPLFWFNTVFWFVHSELRAIQGYQVDRDVQLADDRFAYPELLF